MATTTGTPFLAVRTVRAPAVSPARRLDPRLPQIAALAFLLAYGLLRLDLEVRPARAAIVLATALATQYACSRYWRLPAFDVRSALISGISLCLLLRTSFSALAIAGAVLAIGSKFVIRVRGKHVFNPTNFALVVLLLTGQAWVSPGQWGNAALFGFLLACLGGIVATRAARADVTLAFLVTYGGIVVARSLWLGEPMSIPVHRLENGALLIFAFFMISDPRTTPDHRAGRILFAVLVALGGAFVQLRLFRTNGLLWSLAAFAPLVPLIDRVLPAPAPRGPVEPPRRSA